MQRVVGKAALGVVLACLSGAWGCDRDPEPRLEPGTSNATAETKATPVPPPEGGAADRVATLQLVAEGDVTVEQLETTREALQARAEVILGPTASAAVTVEAPSRLRVVVSGEADASMLPELGMALIARGRLELAPMVPRYEEQQALDALAELAGSADALAYSEGYLVVPGDDTHAPPPALRALAEAHRDLWPDGQRVVYELAPTPRVDPPHEAPDAAVRWRMRLVESERTLASPGIVSAQVEASAVDGTTQVAVRLDEHAAGTFHTMTRAMVGEQLAIVLDGVVVSAPVVREPIGGGRLWIQPGLERGFDGQRRRAQVLAGVLRAELGAALRVESLEPR